MAIIDTTKHDDSDAESISSSTVLVNEQQLTASVTSITSTTSFVVVDGEPTAAEVAPHTSSEEALQQQQQAPLTIPLDAAPVKRVTVDGVLGDNSGVAGSRGLMRRDSLKRRESLLKGKEGSRRRQRWENDHFTHNPHYTAPEPRDFAPEPVHPKRIVRYEFASLWDPTNPKMFGYNTSSTSTTTSPHSKQKSIGTVTKNLRDRVKRSEWAVGLLRDLEEEVRRYAAGLFGCSASAVSRCSSVTPDENKEKEKRRQKRGGKRKLKTRHGGNGRSSRSSSVSSSTSSLVVVSDTEGGVGLLGNEEGEGGEGQEQEVEVAVVEDSVKDSEDEEIVFVPKMARMSLEDAATEQPPPPPSPPSSSLEKDGAVMTEEEVEQVQLEKPMFEAPASDPSASFVRWLIHSIALYYGLRSWSVDVGSNPQMRVAFVGVNPSISSSRKALAKMRKNEHLPRPLWRML